MGVLHVVILKWLHCSNFIFLWFNVTQWGNRGNGFQTCRLPVYAKKTSEQGVAMERKELRHGKYFVTMSRTECFFLFVHCPSYDCERQSQLWEREREYAPPGILSVRLGHPCSLQRPWHKPRLPDEIITTYRKNRTLSPDAWNTTCPFSTPIESKFTIALRSYVHSRPKIESGVVGTLILYTLPNM